MKTGILALMMFYHIKNLQSTKTRVEKLLYLICFITLRIYKVLKPTAFCHRPKSGFITLRIYKVLKHIKSLLICTGCFITLRIYKVLKLCCSDKSSATSFITLRIYKVLKPQQRKNAFANS